MFESVQHLDNALIEGIISTLFKVISCFAIAHLRSPGIHLSVSLSPIQSLTSHAKASSRVLNAGNSRREKLLKFAENT
jgi:hypothetical protein